MLGLGLQIPAVALRTTKGRLPEIQPSADWSGAPDSGFSTIPSDPLRLTAKPAASLITVPNQRFVDSLDICVMAFASDNGTLIGGIDRVRFHFEGNVRDVLQPRIHRFIDANGIMRSYWGYWVTIRRPAGKAGTANLYVEAIPADATMQRRVIGPFRFFPRATLYDSEITVTPSAPAVAGRNYHSVAAAIAFHGTSGNEATLITITEPLTEALSVASPNTVSGSYCVVTATAPVTFSRPSYIGDLASRLFVGLRRVCFRGSNITFDLRHARAIERGTGAGEDFWFDGCNFTNSGGRGAAWRGGPRPVAYVALGAPWFTEVNFSNLPNVAKGASLVRGCTGTNLFTDFSGNGTTCVYNRINSLNSYADWLVDTPAMEVSYSGAQVTATLAKNASQIFTATWGANSATFRVRNTEAQFNAWLAGTLPAGEGYWPQDVANWLNGLPGWNATVLNNSRTASGLSVPDRKGASFTAVTVVGTTRTLVSCFDLHGDFYQVNNNVNVENAIVAFNTGIAMQCQNFHLPSQDFLRDFFIVSNAMSNVLAIGSNYGDYLTLGSAAGGASGGNPSHVVWAHNTMPTQQLRLGDIAQVVTDSYCMVANNAVLRMSYTGTGAPRPNLIVKDNVQDAGFDVPLGATGTVAAGTFTSKFVDAFAGNFTPAGELRANPSASTFAIDLDGRPSSTLSPVGAVHSE